MRKKIPLIGGIINLIESLKGDIGIIENTDVATHSISAGSYVIWKNELYKASSAIAVDDALSSSNLTAVSGGAANELNNNTFRKPDFSRVLHSVSPNGLEQSYTMEEDGFVNCYGWGPSNNTGFANLRPAGTTGLNINFGWAQGGQIFGGVCYASKGDVIAYRGASGNSGSMTVYGLK